MNSQFPRLAFVLATLVFFLAATVTLAREGSHEPPIPGWGGKDGGGKRKSKKSEPIPAPDFQLTTLEGTTYSLQELRGKVVVLNFWATSCLPCRTEMPSLNRLAKRYADEEVVFLAPALDSELQLRHFLSTEEFNWEIAPADYKLFSTYSNGSIPMHVVINRDGSIRWLRTGASSEISSDLAWNVKRALKE